MKAAIQDAAYQAIVGLRVWCLELQTSHTFVYFPRRIMGPISGIRYLNPAHPGTNRSQRQLELVRDLDWACRCTTKELIENRRALGLVQAEIRSIEALHPESNKN